MMCKKFNISIPLLVFLVPMYIQKSKEIFTTAVKSVHTVPFGNLINSFFTVNSLYVENSTPVQLPTLFYSELIQAKGGTCGVPLYVRSPGPNQTKQGINPTCLAWASVYINMWANVRHSSSQYTQLKLLIHTRRQIFHCYLVCKRYASHLLEWLFQFTVLYLHNFHEGKNDWTDC